ncbi:Aste57867_21285 [Aphanomyces stellatus]|uniref:Aste57867_21285 protein n=1 Tax=Aphanomyces stellatus TaxID=120398 RepID=A0A485LLQ9_9STRA|nr:hypothetical protein As57867_021216 [Aphanomyces stellatus]VFT97957.1 Aste57867_21285 [Aphanomyces stellatus]
MSKVRSCLLSHWTVTPPVKSAAQIEAEKHLLCIPWFRGRFLSSSLIPFNRWILFGAAFLSQFCCGSLYAWSIYNVPMDLYIYNNPTEGKAVYAFYLACVLLGSAATIVGPWLERHGPQRGLVLGTTCFLTGYIVATISLSYKSMLGVYLGYGVISGFGIGVNYITPASALIKWFPDMRGTAAGFAVGGFGASSILWSKVYLPAIDAFGLPSSFLFLGCLMSLVMYTCAIIMRTPPPGYTVGGVNIHGVHVETDDDLECELRPFHPHDNDDDDSGGDEKGDEKGDEHGDVPHVQLCTPRRAPALDPPTGDDNVDDTTRVISHQVWLKQVQSATILDSLCSVDFVGIHLALFGNIVFGLTVISRLSSMAQTIFHRSPTEASTLVSLNGIFTCTGQIAVPMVSDLLVRKCHVRPPLARKLVYLTASTTQVIIMLTLPTVLRQQLYTVFRVQVWLLMICYGGAFGTVAAFLTDMFGAHNIGALHGCGLTAWSLAGLVGGLGFTLNYNHLVHVKHYVPVEAFIENMHWVLGLVLLGLVAVSAVRTNHHDRFAPKYQYSLCGKSVIRFSRVAPTA